MYVCICKQLVESICLGYRMYCRMDSTNAYNNNDNDNNNNNIIYYICYIYYMYIICIYSA